MTEYTYMVVYRVIMVYGAFYLHIDAAELHRPRIRSRRGFSFQGGATAPTCIYVTADITF
jgi:hypothetical protein